MKPEATAPDRLKRLIYRSVHRGCKETDLIFAQFASLRLSGLDAASLDTYENLLEEADADIWQWLVGAPCPAEYAPLIALLAEYKPATD
ncbi:MAG: succinate dehydrogenase assembly factor 2 [Proteobacteria bacterium]|nr:succinate dehydrogenase assembly factor 2 [Pseudomonadota bacterium]